VTAAERLAERNQVIAALADVDAKIRSYIKGGKPSYRNASACRELLDIRSDLAATLISLGGQPSPPPIVKVA
jgi:hypothetical protein